MHIYIFADLTKRGVLTLVGDVCRAKEMQLFLHAIVCTENGHGPTVGCTPRRGARRSVRYCQPLKMAIDRQWAVRPDRNDFAAIN